MSGNNNNSLGFSNKNDLQIPYPETTIPLLAGIIPQLPDIWRKHSLAHQRD